ncbi:MAG: Ppx/GppA phosphatase family protein [Proteobacteria bacterium]|jgi:exopolyphosphatase/guanosine-5'-triphosphate,3'-diphosphate pyrophosphatase|nr:Ppx/GppA phosphatase family protein [Pseudomonadota bacterium]
MKYASIDIGTNTVLLLIVDAGKDVRDVLDISTITRLGEGLKKRGNLSKRAMTRTFSALKNYKELAERHGVKGVYCVGTSALREAKNSEAFLRLVKDKLGISIRVISGYEEAYYTYLSIKHDERMKGEQFIIIDIGGGSTEVIKGNREEFTNFVSLPIGSVKLTEMFVRHDPPEDNEIASLTGFIRETISFPFDGKNCRVIGTAGTITNLASIILGLENYDKSRIHGLNILYKDIGGVIKRLKAMTTPERRAIRGMEKGREDIILQGIILLKEIMSYFKADEIIVSANGVRYGVIYEKLGSLLQ